MVLFTALEGDPTTEIHSLDIDTTRTDTVYTVDANIVPSSVTYLMLTVTVVDMMRTTATHEVRYPITDVARN